MKRWITGLCLLLNCCQRPEPVVRDKGEIHFRDVAEETGLVFRHVSGQSGKYYMPEIMGAGVALIDYDNDGDLDVFLVQSGSLEKPAGGNKLFRNDLIPSGKLRFTDVSAEAGISGSGYGMGVATADYDQDGWTDLLVTEFGGATLYRNLGNGRFAGTPIGDKSTWTTSAAFFDYDKDGWLDLIVLSYVDFSLKNNKQCNAPTGELDYCTPVAYRAVPAHLYHNEKGRFVDVSAKAGIDAARGPGLGVVTVDVNGDGYPDLFVANDTAQNHLWLNRKNGTFKESSLEAGVAYSEDGLAKAGMGVAAGDYNNDGYEDLLVLNLMREGATLFRNDGKGSFSDVSKPSKVHTSTFFYTGFGVGMADFDNDGWLDFFLANGAVTIREEQRGEPRPFKEKNLILRNKQDGTFEDVSMGAGPIANLMEISRGAAFGDIDNDGRMDLLISNNDGPARLYLNRTRAGNWLRVTAQPPGTRVLVEREGMPTLLRVARSDGSYASANDLRMLFGIGETKTVKRVLVGEKEYRDVAAGSTVGK